jgi:signal peptidase II
VPAVALLVVLLDQWSKGWVEANIPMGEGLAPFPALSSYLNLVHFENTGASFGLFRGQNSFFIIVGLVVVAAVLYFSYTMPQSSLALRLLLGVMLGGAIGNLIDRVQHGHVTDFLLFSLPVGGRVYAWPAFNVADSSIVVGAILLGLLLLFIEGRQPNVTGSTSGDAQT